MVQTTQTAEKRLFKASYPAGATSVGAIRDGLAAFAREAGAPGPQVESVRLAASEAASNAVVHAYEPGTTGDVDVSAEWDEGVLTVVVEDAGRGLHSDPGRTGLGAGLTIIARVADHVELSPGRRGCGLRLSMRFGGA
jgi:serine/threonine-protein kinase RsbW/stage II sporulation protein AB (anti-sigma F factor)